LEHPEVLEHQDLLVLLVKMDPEENPVV